MKFKDVEIDEENADIVFVALVQTISLLAYRENNYLLMERIELADYHGAMNMVSEMHAKAETEFEGLREQFMTASESDGLFTQIALQVAMAKQRDLRMVVDTFDAYVAVTGELPVSSLSNLMREVDAKQKASMN